ncbi:MAG TPA: hypothetical protein VEU62_02440 [Bryobacterales bacterium]|nr:hypothetical protein [Bryobacterales bacterium]
MKLGRVISTAALSLVLGTIAPAYGQHDQQEKQDKPEKQQGQQHQQGQRAQQPQQQSQPQQQERQRAQQPQQQNRPQQHEQQRAQQPQQQSQPQQQERQRAQQQQPQRTRQQARVWQQQRGWLQQGGWQGQGTWQQDRAQHWQNEHRSWRQRGGYGGYYIPQDRFFVYFGSQHWFRIGGRPTIFMGYPRFQYGGFSFILVDPWPEYWREDWYATDDVYVDYDDGYYLYNRRYPGVGIAISLVL